MSVETSLAINNFIIAVVVFGEQREAWPPALLARQHRNIGARKGVTALPLILPPARRSRNCARRADKPRHQSRNLFLYYCSIIAVYI